MIRPVVFLLILFLLLKGASWISVQMDRNPVPILNHSARGIFEETDNTIDILFIGDSNVYSGISPMKIWKDYGYSSYSWGEPSQRIAETYEYLKEIFQHQKPKVVFIEVGNVFRDQSIASNLDSITKSKVSRIFPLVTYHKSLDVHRIGNLFSDRHSMTKGYYVRTGIKKTKIKKNKMKFTKETEDINIVNQWLLKQCVSLCRKNGCKAFFLSVPSYESWSWKKHNTLQNEADKNNVEYLDLNLAMVDVMDWSKDTPDKGIHLNIAGAEKVSGYLGNFIKENMNLEDHRKNPAYKQWNIDAKDILIHEMDFNEIKKIATD